MRRATFLGAVFVCVALAIGVLVGVGRGEGVSPLMRAAKSGDVKEVERLIGRGAEIDGQSRYGWTALMFAAWQGHQGVVRVLLEAGADPTISSVVVPSGFETVGGHPPSSALHEAIREGHLGIAEMLIRGGAAIDGGAVALAGRSGQVDLLALLEEQGADWDVSSGNAFYATPLCAAASAGKGEAVRWLIGRGADPNLVAVGQTALKAAIENDEVEIVAYLLEQGADPNLVYGSTEEAALFTAVTKHTTDRSYPANLAIIQMLLRHGADPGHRAFGVQHTALEFLMIQRANTMGYLGEAKTEKVRSKIRASLAHRDAVIALLRGR